VVIGYKSLNSNGTDDEKRKKKVSLQNLIYTSISVSSILILIFAVIVDTYYSVHKTNNFDETHRIEMGVMVEEEYIEIDTTNIPGQYYPDVDIEFTSGSSISHDTRLDSLDYIEDRDEREATEWRIYTLYATGIMALSSILISLIFISSLLISRFTRKEKVEKVTSILTHVSAWILIPVLLFGLVLSFGWFYYYTDIIESDYNFITPSYSWILAFASLIIFISLYISFIRKNKKNTVVK
jgi:hypothetical protein